MRRETDGGVVERALAVATPQRLEFAAYLVAALFALPALAFPYGGDAAIFDYIGRAALDGKWPYAEAGDIKPPVIYIIYALARLLFLGEPWGIRVLEIATLCATGFLAGRTLRQLSGYRWMGGVCALALVVFHFSRFGFWSLGQVEVWEAFALMLALCIVASPNVSSRGLFVAGAACGVAVLCKYPAVLPGAGIAIFALFLRKARGQWSLNLLASTVGWMTAGGVASVAILLVPFALAGHWQPMWEYLVVFLTRYARIPMDGFPPLLVVNRFIWPLLACAGLVALGTARVCGAESAQRNRFVALVAIAALSALQVVIQGKFFNYHWQVVAPFLLLTAIWGARLWFRSAGWTGAVLIGVVLLATLSPPGVKYRGHAAAGIDYLLGRLDREAYLDRFFAFHSVGAVARLSNRVLEDIGDRNWQEEPTLCVVNSMAAQFYTFTELSCPTRFFLSHHLSSVRELRAAFRPINYWLDEYDQALARSPPAYVVVRTKGKLTWRPLWSPPRPQYELMTTFGTFRLFKRRPDAQ